MQYVTRVVCFAMLAAMPLTIAVRRGIAREVTESTPQPPRSAIDNSPHSPARYPDTCVEYHRNGVPSAVTITSAPGVWTKFTFDEKGDRLDVVIWPPSPYRY